MKTLMKVTFLMAFFSVLTAGCDKDYGYSGGGGDIGGSQSPIGAVGNTFTASTVTGFSNVSGEVTELVDGVSNVRISATITDTKMLALLEHLSPDKDFVSFDSRTGQLTADLKVKFTDQGIAEYNHHKGTGWTVVDYGDGVGQKYAYKDEDGEKYDRTVTQKSTEDDFPYGFWDIKTITVEEPSRSPLISKITYKFNHRFGPVYVKMVLPDGHIFESRVYSYAENE